MPPQVRVVTSAPTASPCFDYAVEELARMLARIGVTASTSVGAVSSGPWQIQILPANAQPIIAPKQDRSTADGYAIAVTESGVTLAAVEPKGVLNAVYDLAERLGFLFLYPGIEGEWPPEAGGARPSLPVGSAIVNPRFPHRGVFNGCSEPDWAAFYAKLRLNTICNPIEADLARKLGLRVEVGGHDLSELLPRKELGDHPEMFRMAQPEDFFGKRTNDYNFCVTSPQARHLIQTNYLARIRPLHDQGIYAWHTWPEDLPLGGWCCCPTCRSLAPSDQAMVAMGLLAEVLRQERIPMRVPMLAYHDTMFPGRKITPPKEAFLLFAPRERCYGHAIDDPTCSKNCAYFQALEAWTAAFRGADDAHTFEYYLDRVLYRGLYPFLPDVILRDMRVYEAHGIQTHLALQVGTAFVPRLVMLNLSLFARGMWDANLNTARFIGETSTRILPADPSVWRACMSEQAAIYGRVMRWEHPPDIWSDYRWLPETPLPYGNEMASIYHEGAAGLSRVADALERAIVPGWPDRVKTYARSEVARIRYDAAAVALMAVQQDAANRIGAYLNTGRDEDRVEGIRVMQDALKAIDTAKEKARGAEIPDSDYCHMFHDWLAKELKGKIASWQEKP